MSNSWNVVHEQVLSLLSRNEWKGKISSNLELLSKVETGLRLQGLRIEASNEGDSNPLHSCLTPYFHIGVSGFPELNQYKKQEKISKKFCIDNNLNYDLLVEEAEPYDKWKELRQILDKLPRSRKYKAWRKRQEKQIKLVDEIIKNFYSDYLGVSHEEKSQRLFVHYYLFVNGLLRLEFGGEDYNCMKLEPQNKKEYSEERLKEIQKEIYKEVELFADYLQSLSRLP